MKHLLRACNAHENTRLCVLLACIASVHSETSWLLTGPNRFNAIWDLQICKRQKASKTWVGPSNQCFQIASEAFALLAAFLLANAWKSNRLFASANSRSVYTLESGQLCISCVCHANKAYEFTEVFLQPCECTVVMFSIFIGSKLKLLFCRLHYFIVRLFAFS